MHSRTTAGLFALGLVTLALGAAEQTNCQMLIPGFTVRELPVRLSNINNLRFTPDGQLSALGYDGRVHILRDTDGDGLEDTATVFWDKTTLTVPVGMAWTQDGLYVSSHGKVSRLRDTDGDGKADVEEVIASGWPATDVASGGVDATAVTIDRDRNLYFGLLTADYSNPYRVKDGQSRYDLHGLRGTIQKWSVSSRKLETIATGIRVPYTLAFNRLGDLFVTDQEGETWCPGGNPLDELNHIVAGRNYGFPPRHEKYLPDLVSDPPVVAFGPQHQSTCGLVFNETRPGGKGFGPAAWEGDAFVAGESRGKIWRVRLVRTPTGYVGRETLIARLNMLTMDVAISPGGDLYCCCHSGDPDWGTGPQGRGKLFKISLTDTQAPQPVAAWPSGQQEVRVAFDRGIDGAVTNLAAEMKLEFGEYVSAADRLEVLKPPYQAVKDQEAAPRGRLRVVAARLSSDARTLVLTTDPQPQSVRYALTLPGVRAANSTLPPATVDLAYDLNGVAATWSAAGATGADWSGWLPHPAWQVSTAFTAGSAEHARLSELVRRKGSLRLQTQLVLPADARIHATASARFVMALGTHTVRARPGPANSWMAEAALSSAGQPEPLSLDLETGGAPPLALDVSYSTGAEPTRRPLPFNASLLPWAPAHHPPPISTGGKPELAGGDYERGRSLFYGERLKCSTCHRLRNQGNVIGPDLSNLTQRDAASVLRDLQEPSASIHPDYVAYEVRLRAGGELTGFVRALTEGALRVVGADGKETILPRSEVSELRPSAVSLMPSGLLDGLQEAQVRDLLTFLLHDHPIRSAADVEAVRGPPEAKETEAAAKPLNIVLVASKQDHGPGQHDYPAWQKQWDGLLGKARHVTVTNAWEWPSPEQFRQADVIVFYYWNHDWSAERYRELDDYQARGGGMAIFHAGTIADHEPERLAERIGLASQPGPTKYLHTPLVLKFVAPTNHPVTRGFSPLNLLDEPYWPMIGDTNRIEILATTEVEGAARPMLWTCLQGPGRVFVSIIGHYTATFDDPLFRILALRGVAWAAGVPAARFDDLK